MYMREGIDGVCDIMLNALNPYFCWRFTLHKSIILSDCLT